LDLGDVTDSLTQLLLSLVYLLLLFMIASRFLIVYSVGLDAYNNSIVRHKIILIVTSKYSFISQTVCGGRKGG